MVAWGVFQKFGASWLDSRFDAQLQRLRHDHAQELEHLRFRIAGLLDRATKLSAKEFDVLPEAWARVFDAHVATMRLLQRLRFDPDFSRINDQVLQAILDDGRLEPWQKDEIRSLPVAERGDYYRRCRNAILIQEAQVAAREAEFYLAKRGVFIDETVRVKLADFLAFIRKATNAWEMVLTARQEREIYAGERHDEAYRGTAERQVSDLEAIVRKHFRDKA